MFATVTWKISDGALHPGDIEVDVHRAFRTLQRCELWPGAALLGVRNFAQWSEVVADLQNIEQVYTTQFSFAIFEHNDRQGFVTSEPFDAAAALAVTR